MFGQQKTNNPFPSLGQQSTPLTGNQTGQTTSSFSSNQNPGLSTPIFGTGSGGNTSSTNSFSNPTSSNLFGALGSNQNQSTSTFNSTPSGMFGNQQTNNQTSAFGGQTSTTNQGSIFGGSTNQATPSFGGQTSSFGGNQSNQSSVFGGNTGTTNSGSLFGGTTSGTNTTSVFGGNNQSSTGAFGQTSTSGTGLFGSTSSSNFRPTQNPSSNMSFSQPAGFNPGIMSSSSNVNNMNKEEIIAIIRNYSYAINNQSPHSLFKLIVYNRVEPKREHEIAQLQEYKQQIKSIDNLETIPVDHSLWLEALQKNPNPKIYYPYQINGPKQLCLRVNIVNSLQHLAFENIIEAQKKVDHSLKTYDHDIQNILLKSKKKLNQIKSKEISVISKLEALALKLNRADKDFNMESKLIHKLNTLKANLFENGGIVPVMEEMNLKANYIQFSIKGTSSNSEIKKGKMDKIKSSLTELKKLFDITYRTLSRDYNTINFISSEMENIQKYGK